MLVPISIVYQCSRKFLRGNWMQCHFYFCTCIFIVVSCHYSLPLFNPIFISLLILQSLFLFQFFIFYVCLCCINIVGWNSVVTIICYGLDGPGMEFWWWRDFPHPSRQPWCPTILLYNGYCISGRAAVAWC